MSKETSKAFAEPDFRALFEASPGAFLVLDPGLHIVAMSEAYLEATRTSRAALLGRHLFEVFPDNPDDPSADAVRNTRASLQRVLHSRKADTMVVQRHDIRRPDSEGGGFEPRYWSPVNSPVLRPDGSIAYIIHRVENVTDYMLLKQQGVEQGRQTEALRERALQTEAELYARSREVAEASLRLKQANEELARLYERTRELDELRSRFFANVSHELRTPLTLILGPVERLLGREAPGDEELRRELRVVQRNARLLHRHVEDLLDAARLDAGHMRLRYVRTDLARLARLAASHFESLAGERHIRLEVHAPAALPAEADREKLERMLINLLSNAFKFTPDGGAVRLALTPGGGRVRIEVQDSGPGVPEPLREAVFERFRQGEGGMERQHGGTGLGLSIVREFASLHGGSAGVTEAPGGGALFTLDLPLAAPDGTPVAADTEDTGDTEDTAAPDGEAARRALDELQPRSRPPAPGPRPADASAPHVLVVEDNPDMNAFLADALGRHYWISRAFDGREGLEKALADPPDLILSDLMMPGMSGERMVEELRRHGALDDVPVVMLTAKADEALRIEMLGRGGVQDYLHKPFSVEELLARVGGLLAQRRRTGRRLRLSEERFRATFEQAAVGIAHLAPDGRCLRVNRRLCDIVGRSREALLALRFQDITHPDEVEADREQAARLIAGEIASGSRETRWLHGDGHPVWVHLTLALVRDEAGVPDYFIAVLEDIRRRKEQEQALRDADRRKDEFLAVLAHELRNPLAPIRNGVQILQLASRAGRQSPAELLAMMERQLAHVARLLDDLLDVSRITRGRLELRKERIELVQALRAVVEANRSILEARRHELVLSLPPEPLVLDADPVRLAQIFSNLLDNAAKYTGPGGRIELAARAQADRVQVSVRDSGVGIPPDELGAIFELFHQVGSPLSRDQGGLGIGLSLTRVLAELHGGRVEARSAGPGRGSEFTVVLPLVVEPTAASSPDGGDGARAGLGILVVDDNRDAASSLAQLIGMLGHEVRTAHGGEEGVGVAAEFRPELVLLDLGMPGMDGFETCRRLRAQPAGPHMTVIAVTGWGQDEDRRRTAQAGFDHHWVKPVDPQQLMQVLDELQARRHPGAPPGPALH